VVGPQDVFQQCHEHLRIAEQRRDIAVGVLVTLVIAILALLKEDGNLPAAIELAFTAIAVFTFILLGVYRRWKLIHLHAASLFMKFPQDSALPCKHQAEKEWKKIIKASHARSQWESWKPKNLWESIWKSGDLWFQLIAATVSAIIAVPFLSTIMKCFLEKLNVTEVTSYFFNIAALLLWFVVALIAHYGATKNLSFPDYAWMFRGLKNSDDTGSPQGKTARV
jgi:hypothetical protein